MVCDELGRVLALERTDHPGAWQLPQGGIEQDEDAPTAMWRELSEETGLTPADVELVHEVPEWLGYELPPESRSDKTGRGQVHKWFVLRASDGATLQIRLDAGEEPEFCRYRWSEPSDVVPAAVSFRQPVYWHLMEVLARLAT